MEKNPPGREDPQLHYPVSGPEDSPSTDPDRALWKQFVEATNPKAFCQSWLPLQCRLLGRVRCGMVLLGAPDRGPFTPVAVWPDSKLSA